MQKSKVAVWGGLTNSCEKTPGIFPLQIWCLSQGHESTASVSKTQQPGPDARIPVTVPQDVETGAHPQPLQTLRGTFPAP